ncbi:DUF7507 domain-containing protein [Lysobacter capsici]|uniref:DUF7507 domain-containing protein n=1 Tax=Lysobacter capsici TaxID=435897 RepID=UPI0012FE5EF9|nr:OmpA family protein [Lysobacter capsici]
MTNTGTSCNNPGQTFSGGVCTSEDSDPIQPRLTLIKTVTNNNGGTAVATAWTLAATGPTNITGATGSAAVTNASVNPGSYTLSESGGPADYAAGTYNCVINGGAAVVSNTVALVAGDKATCTITNTFQANPQLTLVKTAGTPTDVNGNGLTDAGDTIAYTFAVTNPGNVVMNGVAITDAKLSAAPITCTPSTVPAGGTANCGPVTYTITADDVTAGQVDNTATASGTPPGGPLTTSPPSSTSTPTTAVNPQLTLVKTAGTPTDVNGNGLTDAGDTIAYTFAVTNPGNVVMNGVAITDAKLSAAPITCTPSTVPAGGSASCGPVTYTITADDVTAGSVDNTATASGTPPGGPLTTSPPSSTSTPTTAVNPQLTLVKTAGTPTDVNGNGLTDAGDTIAYTFAVTNPGNVVMNGVAITDAKLSAAPITCTPSTVPAGGSASCGPVTYTITADDVTAGSVDNTATASGTPPGGPLTTSPPSTTNTPTTAPTPQLTLVKTAGTPTDVNGNGLTDAGDTIAYTFAVTNPGNVVMNGVAITDAKLSAAPITCTPSTVPAGGSASCGPVTYTITADDVTAGSVDNTATASGTPPGGPLTTSPPSSTSTPTTAVNPQLTLVKTAGTPTDVNGNGLTDAGDTIAYTFAVTNPGNVVMNGVAITDAKLSAAPITCTPSTVPAGGSASCGPVTYTITADDVTAGSVDNTATASGTPPGGPLTTSPPSSTSTPTTAVNPQLTLVKTAGTPTDVNGNGLTDAGDTIAYTFAVTNPGNVVMNGVAITDAKLSAAPITCTPSTVPAGGTANCGPVTYTITADDVTAGSVDNTATASGTPPGGPLTTSPPSTTNTPTTAPTPQLTLVKTAGAPTDVNGNGLTDAGDTIAYTFAVTNPGNVVMNGVAITDAKLSAAPITCTPSTVPAGGSASCGPVTYTITADDVTAGSVDNTATASGTPPGGPLTTSPPSSTSTPTTAVNPQLTLVKTAGTPTDVNGNGLTDAGDTIAYTFAVTNPGNVVMNGVAITDAKLSAAPITCTPSTVPAGGSASCGPVTYTITADDVTAGSVDNTATASGTPPGGPLTTSPPSTTNTPTTAPTPQLTLVKTAGTPTDVNGNGLTDAGDTIAYTFAVTNPGNVVMNGVAITDAKLSAAPITCTPSTVPAGGSASCGPVTYTITADDVTAGSVDNTATASGTPPGGPLTTSPPSSTSTPTTAVNPQLTLVKTAGTPTDVNGNGLTDAGDTIAYTFAVTNPGNVVMNGVAITDAKLSAAPITCTPSTVPAGGSASCGPVTYTITADDVTAGQVDNTATASGTPPGGPLTTSPPSSTSTPTTAVNPQLTLVKTAGAPTDVNGNGLTDAGDTIAYTFAVTNPGNVVMNGVAITDAKLSAAPITCTPSTVPAGGSASCGPVTYTITADDVTAGSVDNTATASGTPPGGPLTTSPPSTTNTPTTAPTPQLTLVKTAGTPTDVNGNGLTDAGDTIAYTFAVTNPGNVVMNGVAITDAKLSAAPITCTPSTVPAGGSASCGPVTYTITADDVTAGSVDNTATASGTPPGGPLTTSPPSTTNTPTTAPTPQLTLVKTAGTPTDVNGNGLTDAGDTIAYTFAVTNPGNVVMNGVAITDAKLSAAPITCTPSTVPAGGSASCGPVTYTITADDVTAGQVDNTATASGTPPGGPLTTSPPSSTSTPTTAVNPQLTLVKTAGTPTDVNGNGLTDAGDTIAYTFAVTNPGNVVMNGVAITDAKLSAAPITCTPSTVPAGGSASCGPVTYTITADDVTAGQVDNTATASGTPPGGPLTTSPPSSTSTPTTAVNPQLTLVKTAGTPTDVNGNGLTDAGDTIAYTFAVTNPGNVVMNGVAITDAKLSAAPITCTPSTVPAGGSASCGPVTYTITADDVTAGSVDNTATASGTPPGGPLTTSPPSSTSTPTTAVNPQLTLVKTAGAPTDVNGNGLTDAGDTIAYTFAVTNPGNVVMNGVAITDAKLSAAPITCTPSTVPAGGSASCGPVTYTITADDVTAGSVDNTATASGTPPGGPLTTSPPSTTNTPTTAPTPQLTLVKTAGTPTDVNGNGLTDAGDTIAYTFAVTNPGNVVMNGVAITDAKLSAAPITCTPSTVPAGGSASCGPVTYTITADDVTAGSVDNTATASGTPPGGPLTTSPPSSTSTPTTAVNPQLTLVKTAGTPTDVNGNGLTDAGDTIAYTFAVTNPGNVVMNGVAITDAKLSAAPITCTPSTVPAGGTANCGPVTYTITADDVTAGSVDNTATASGTPPGGPLTTSPPSTTNTPTTAPTPQLTLVKTAGAPTDVNGNGLTDAGDTIAYTFAVTNPGNVVMNGVAITDAKLSAAPITCTPSTVPAGGSASCGPVTYTITADDVTAGSVDNTATASGTPPGGPLTTSPPSSTSTPTTAVNPQLTLVKTAGTPTDVNGNGLTDAGDTIAYTFAVTNPGNVVMNGVAITDAKLSAAPITCTPSTVPAGGSASCGPVTYTITADDVTAGSVDNTATASGTPPGGPLTTSPPSTTNTPTTAPTPQLTLVKTAGTPTDVNGNGLTDAGDTIAYTFAVTNPGNVVMNGVAITDAKLSAAPITCTPSTVPAGGSASCGPVTYTITADDVTAGSVDNTATASGTPPGGPLTTSPPSSTSTPTTAVNPQLTLVKTAGTPTDVNGNGLTDAGDTIAYTFAVTNPGNVVMNGVAITDAKLSAAPITCTPSTVPAGGSASCGPVTYTITADDVTAGQVDNTATASGTPPGGPLTTSPPSSTSTPTTAVNPQLTLVKTAGAPTDVNGNGLTDAGDTIAYTFAVTNPGNVVMNGVAITDAKLSAAPITCTPSTVPAGGTANCGPVTYTITADDVTAGSVDNTATASGTPPGGPLTTSPPSSTSTPTTAVNPQLTLVKTAGTPTDVNGNGLTDAGDTIAYTFAVTNPGNVVMNGVAITDAKLSAAPITCTPSTVPAGGTANCGPVTYTITADDVTAGSVDNTATASGTPPGGPLTTSPPSTTNTPTTAPIPSLTLVKTAGTPTDVNGNGLTDAGDTIAYTFAVTNPGNVVMNGVAITDAKLSAAPITCTPSTVPAGGSASCGPVTYTITADDVTAGSVDNTATASGTPPGGPLTTSPPSSTSTPTTAVNPQLTLVKTAGTPTDVNGNGLTDAGDTIAYTFAVTNPGNVVMNGVAITDAKLSAAPITCTPSTVPAGGSASCGPVTYTITADDVTAGSVDNTATASGTPPGGPLTTSPPSSTSTPTTAVNPQLTLVKTAGTPTDVNGNGLTDAGDTIAYTFAVTNPGNVVMNGVAITDAKLSAAPITCTPSTVPAGGSASCGPVTYTITADDVTAGSVDNTATASGTPPGGPLTTSPPSSTSTPTTAVNPQLTLVKTAGTPTDVNGNGLTDAGDTIAYTFAVTNPGNVVMNGVAITDAKLSAAPITCTPSTVPAGGTANCGPVTYTITADDVTAGSVDNTATASGTPPGGPLTTSAPSSTSTPTTAVNPQLTLVKTAGAPTTNLGANASVTDAGDTIGYTFVITNTGNVNLTNVVVNDAKLDAPAACNATTLAPNASTTCTGTHTITQEEVNAGTSDNTATATGTPPSGTPVTSSPASTQTPLPRNGELRSTKAMTANADEDGSGSVTVGDTLSYTITVTNIGNIDLGNVVVTDDKITPNTTTCAIVVPGATCVLTGTYRVTPADANAGTIRNAATVVDTPPPGGQPVCPVGSADPKCNPRVDVPVTQMPNLSSAKAMTGNADEDGDGRVSVGDTLTYTVTATNTGNIDLTDVVVSDDKITPSSITCATVAPTGTCVLTGTYKVVQADADNGSVVNTATVSTSTPNVCPAGSTEARCHPTVTVPIEARPAVAIVKVATLTVDEGKQGVGNAGDVITYAVRISNTGNITLNDMATSDVLENYPATTLSCGATSLAPGASTDCNAYTHTITREEANAGGTLDNMVKVTARYGNLGGGGTATGTATADATAIVPVEPEASSDLFVTKQANPRDVKIGDLVRYTLTIKNVGQVDTIDATLTDTPPAGFTLVEGSVQVADRDGGGRQVGSYPIKVDQIDIKAGESATVMYLLRVGAGVRPGTHVNRAYAEDGDVRSNEATAEVQLIADPLLDESLLLGTVFDDRDGDGWQDSADLSRVRVQGGFAADAYIANSTTVDRGDGAKPEPDASSPMLHGIDLGKISARQSEADPVADHRVVISQTLREPKFDDGFALTTAQGITVRMDAAGNTRTELSGDAAKNLTAAEPKVERQVAQTAEGYRVDYIVSNHGIDERGIPGVRIASVEGLLIETDQFGRYHLEGVAGGPWERGRNFILKVDPATLPPGATFTTDNPLVRRLTPGIPVRFDFGVKLPPGEIPGTQEQVEMRIGEVMFSPASAQVTPQYLPAIENMASKIKQYGGGEIVITANGENETLAMDRALAVRKSLETMVDPQLFKALRISVRTDPQDPATMVVGFAQWPLLGTVLFDTDKATIKPKYLPVIAKVAAALEQLRGTRVVITGHTDLRASDEYNVALGMRRTRAVFEAIVAHATPELRQHLRVDISNDPAAPADKPGK